MPTTDNSSSKNGRRLSRSVRLRKYGVVYKKYMKKARTSISKERKPRRRIHNNSRPEKKVSSVKSGKKKKLNDYQKFVKKESRKDKYFNMNAQDRLKAISEEWNVYKRKLSKRLKKIKKK